MTAVNQEMVNTLIQLLGGKANIQTAGNCMTRLRISLHNPQLAQVAQLKKVEGVMGVVEVQNQLQIILGPGKALKAAELVNQALAEQGQDKGADCLKSPKVINNN